MFKLYYFVHISLTFTHNTTVTLISSMNKRYTLSGLVFHINERIICEAKHETSSVFKIGRSPPPSTSASEWQFQIFTV